MSDWIDRLRGQLQNCVNHLDLLKRHAYRSDENKLDKAIESANRCLNETLYAEPLYTLEEARTHVIDEILACDDLSLLMKTFVNHGTMWITATREDILERITSTREREMMIDKLKFDPDLYDTPPSQVEPTYTREEFVDKLLACGFVIAKKKIKPHLPPEYAPEYYYKEATREDILEKLRG